MKHLIIFSIVTLSILMVFNGAQASDEDRDNDGLSNDAEIQIFGTNPDNPDSDFDKASDGQEIADKSDPLKSDGSIYTTEELSALAGPRRIEIDLSDQRLRYYAGNLLVGEIPISAGTAKHPSPLGKFSVLSKIPVKAYSGPDYYLPNTKWNLNFYKGYYIHGAYWHNDFGIRPRSHGCINISYRNMPQLYDFANFDTQIIIQK